VDLVSVAGLSAHVEAGGAEFLDRVWTTAEQRVCRGRPDQLAARWAVKEAVMKALGTSWPEVEWTDISLNGAQMRPSLQLVGTAHQAAQELGLAWWDVSVSHEQTAGDTLAIATVIAYPNLLGNDGAPPASAGERTTA
jgi:holo-[acyl-carrier protein] synthase